MGGIQSNYSIMGIDQSLVNTGVCIKRITEDGVDTGVFSIKPRGLRGSKRLLYIKNKLEKALDYHKVKLAVMEGYSYESISRAHALGEAGGVIKLVLEEKKIPIYVVPPTNVKKFATGSGDASKEAMMKKYNQKDHNIADAMSLCSIGLAIETKQYNTRAEAEVVKATLKNPENLSKKKRRSSTPKTKKYRARTTII